MGEHGSFRALRAQCGMRRSPRKAQQVGIAKPIACFTRSIAGTPPWIDRLRPVIVGKCLKALHQALTLLIAMLWTLPRPTLLLLQVPISGYTQTQTPTSADIDRLRFHLHRTLLSSAPDRGAGAPCAADPSHLLARLPRAPIPLRSRLA